MWRLATRFLQPKSRSRGSVVTHKSEEAPRPQIDGLLKDRGAFNTCIYTPLDVALRELQVRRNNVELKRKVEKYLGKSIPEPLLLEPKVVLARQVTTPNFEIIRFLNVPDSTGLKPLFFEYHEDRLIYKNPSKYRLVRLAFHEGIGKNGGPKRDHVNIIDFDKFHGSTFSATSTLLGKSLVNFHHDLFKKRFPLYANSLFDASSWYKKHGQSPLKYYPKFLALFIYHGILFENFMLDQKEFEFTKNIFLPAFLEIQEYFGVRPLIVALEPTGIEDDEFWLSYPPDIKKLAIDLELITPPILRNGHARLS